MSEHSRRFGGITRIYGTEALERLAAAHACIIGIGGVGSWVAEALARSGVGYLTLIDLDHIAPSNINRQIHALETTLGMAKTEAMAQRIQNINPQCQIKSIEEFITPENVATLLPPADIVIDAIDQVRAKAALISHCHRLGQTMITVGGAGGRSDPAQIDTTDLAHTTGDALAAAVRARLRKEYNFPRDIKQKFGVLCVYSKEPARLPPNADGAPQGLNCAGYGSLITVTASFGFRAAARTIEHILTKG